jgi:hypothetical protein
VRGEKVSRTARKEIDLVIIAARYRSDRDALSILQGYERRGPVWGDIQLFTREMLIDKIQHGERVVTGRLAQLQGDFEVKDRVHLQKLNGNTSLYTGESPTKTDKLNVPLF